MAELTTSALTLSTILGTTNFFITRCSPFARAPLDPLRTCANRYKRDTRDRNCRSGSLVRLIYPRAPTSKNFFWIRYVAAERRDESAHADVRTHEYAHTPATVSSQFRLRIDTASRRLSHGSKAGSICSASLVEARRVYQNGAVPLAPALLPIGRTWSSDGGTDVNQNVLRGACRLAALDERHCGAHVARSVHRRHAGTGRRGHGGRQLRRILWLGFMRGVLGPEGGHAHPPLCGTQGRTAGEGSRCARAPVGRPLPSCAEAGPLWR